jgi:hypothetical protein
VLRRTCGSRKEEITGGWKNCTMRFFLNCNKHEWGNKLQEVEVVWPVAYVGEIRRSKTGF